MAEEPMHDQLLYPGVAPVDAMPPPASGVPPEDLAEEEEDIGPRKRRRKKDPNAPKRPLSAYNIFFRNVRKELKEKPDGETPSFGTLVQTVSQRWKDLSVEEKREHERLAKLDNERYYKEMHEYRQRDDVQTALQNSASKRRKVVGVPKRPLSGYNIFFKEEHKRIKQECQELNCTIAEKYPNTTVEIAKRWAALPQQQKTDLQVKADKERVHNTPPNPHHQHHHHMKDELDHHSLQALQHAQHMHGLSDLQARAMQQPGMDNALIMQLAGQGGMPQHAIQGMLVQQQMAATQKDANYNAMLAAGMMNPMQGQMPATGYDLRTILALRQQQEMMAANVNAQQQQLLAAQQIQANQEAVARQQQDMQHAYALSSALAQAAQAGMSVQQHPLPLPTGLDDGPRGHAESHELHNPHHPHQQQPQSEHDHPEHVQQTCLKTAEA